MPKLNKVLAVINDAAKLRDAVSSLSPGESINLLERLPIYIDRVRPDAVPNVGPVFLGLLHQLPQHSRSFEDEPPLWRLFRVIRMLVARIEDLDARALAVAAIARQAGTLTERLVALQSVGHHMSDESVALLPADRREPIVAECHAAIRAASIPSLRSEIDAYRLLREVASGSPHPDAEQLLQDEGLMLSILRSALWVGHGGPVDEVAQHRILNLPWEDLETLFGAARWNSRARQVVESVDRIHADESTREALETADKYLSGWRPPL